MKISCGEIKSKNLDYLAASTFLFVLLQWLQTQQNSIEELTKVTGV